MAFGGFRMFSSLAKGLAGGLIGLNNYFEDIAYHARMSERYGPNFKEIIDAQKKKAAVELQTAETDLATRQLMNESRLLELEGKESELQALSGGMRAGQTTSERAYKPEQLGGRPEGESDFELRPVSRAEEIGRILADRSAMAEMDARRKQLDEEEKGKRLREKDEAIESRAAQDQGFQADKEARDAEEAPLRKRKLELEVAKANQEVEAGRKVREGGAKLPAGLFDDMVLNEARRLAPEVEEARNAESDDLSEPKPIKLSDFPPDVVDRALENVSARQTESAARKKARMGADESVRRFEERRRRPRAEPGSPEEAESETSDFGEADFIREDDREATIKEKSARGEDLSDEEREYVKRLGRYMRSQQ